jgi:hypothetical protein
MSKAFRVKSSKNDFAQNLVGDEGWPRSCWPSKDPVAGSNRSKSKEGP